MIAGVKHHLAGPHLILAVAGAILASIVLMYIAILAIQLLIVAAIIVGIYYAVQWGRSLFAK